MINGFLRQKLLLKITWGLGILACLAMFLVLLPSNQCIPNAFAQEVLKGRVEQTAKPVSDKLQGQVIDAKTGQPLAGAQVSLPDQGFSMKTNANGEYEIPRFFGQKPVIMSVQKPGYFPFSVSISKDAPPKFTIRLQKQAQGIVLDTQLRHLGDGSFSPFSSAAAEFRKPPDGPAMRYQFSLDGVALSNSPCLKIGSIIGLDTAMAHYLSGNHIGVNASPLLVKLNGNLIARVQVNGDDQKIMLPKDLLHLQGVNTLEIEAGFHYPEPGRIDYDDMEMMHLVVYP